MSFITYAFGWVLLICYQFLHSYFWALFLFALVVRLIQVPFQMKSKRSSMRMARLTPKIKELEKQYGDDKQKLQQAQAKLYKDEKVNPMSGCLWSLLPLVIIFLLYGAIRQPLTYMMNLTADNIKAIGDYLSGLNLFSAVSGAYSEIPLAQTIHLHFQQVVSQFPDLSKQLVNLNFNFVGLNLGDTPGYTFWTFGSSQPFWQDFGLFLLPLISGAVALISMQISMKTGPQMPQQGGGMKGMMLMGPAMSLIFGFMMPAALSVYWIWGSVLIAVQELILNKHYKKVLDAEDAVRREQERVKEEELEKKRLETERLRAEGKLSQNKNTSKKKQQALERAKEENRQAAERAKRKEELGLVNETPASQVDTRRYARGRAYVGDRYSNPEEAEEATARAAEESAAASADEDATEGEFAPSAEESAVDELPALPELPELPSDSGEDAED